MERCLWVCLVPCSFLEVIEGLGGVGWIHGDTSSESFGEGIELKSLILAQIERWRHALHMQVGRQRGGDPGGEWRTGE